MKLKELRELYNLARDASRFAYSPYSKFPVGAAVKTKKGVIYTGSNVENAIVWTDYLCGACCDMQCRGGR